MLITLASEAYETFKGSETLEKRKMINFVFQNLKLSGKKLQTSLRFPFDIFEKTTTCTKMAGRMAHIANLKPV
ncbi:recombinase RecB [Candidatus Tisiphia endosymbiont of Hybos culiciformis]|uniref:recombinase RecB n=1 Tax=Candidatus Tisiphia endosymbiont of Hybos culiciformis TaxID=3139331 RepID=UPI003CCAD2B5